MSVFITESITTTTLTQSDLVNVRSTQRAILNSGFADNSTETGLEDALSAVSAIASVLFVASTPASLAAGVFSAIAGSGSLNSQEEAIQNGFNYLNSLDLEFEADSSLQSVTVTLPLLVFDTPQGEWSAVSGPGAIESTN